MGRLPGSAAKQPCIVGYRREWKGQTLLVIANLSRESNPGNQGKCAATGSL